MASLGEEAIQTEDVSGEAAGSLSTKGEDKKDDDDKDEDKDWTHDRATRIALITGLFSTIVTLLNALFQ